MNCRLAARCNRLFANRLRCAVNIPRRPAGSRKPRPAVALDSAGIVRRQAGVTASRGLLPAGV
jgi:hypothetical protein